VLWVVVAEFEEAVDLMGVCGFLANTVEFVLCDSVSLFFDAAYGTKCFFA